MLKYVDRFLMKSCKVLSKIKQPAYCAFKLYSNNDYVSDKTLVKQAIATKINEDWNDRNCIAEQIANGEFNKIIFTQKRAGTSSYLKMIQDTLKERGIESELIDFSDEDIFNKFQELVIYAVTKKWKQEEKIVSYIRNEVFSKFKSESVTLWDNLDIAFSRIVKMTEKKYSGEELDKICLSILYFRRYLRQCIIENNSDKYNSNKIVFAIRTRFGKPDIDIVGTINISAEWRSKKRLMNQGFFSEYIELIDKRFIYNTDRYICDKTCPRRKTCDKKMGRFYAREIESKKARLYLRNKMKAFAEIAEGNPFFVVGPMIALGLTRNPEIEKPKTITKNTKNIKADDIIKDYFKNIIWGHKKPKILSGAYYNATRGKFYDFFEILPLYYANYRQSKNDEKLSYEDFYNLGIKFFEYILTKCEDNNCPAVTFSYDYFVDTYKTIQKTENDKNYYALNFIGQCLIENDVLRKKPSEEKEEKEVKKETSYVLNKFVYYVFSGKGKDVNYTIKTYKDFEKLKNY